MDNTSRRIADDHAVSGAPADPETQARVVEIRAGIEQTREELSETIDAIQERLRPRNVVADATERVKAAATEKVKNMAHTAGETAQDMAEQTRHVADHVTRSVRDNPVPALLIGVGTAWMLMNRSSSAPRPWSGADRPRGADYRGTSRNLADYGTSGTYRERFDEGSGSGLLARITHHPVPAALAGVGLAWLAFANGDDRAGNGQSHGRYYGSDREQRIGVPRDAQSGYDAPGSGISDAARSVASQAQHVASRTQDYMEGAADEVRLRGRRAQTQLQRLLHDNPLMVGAAAVVLGAAVGMALPETEREREWMGDARDQMVDRAQELAQNAVERVQEAAGDVAGDVVSRVVSGKDE